MFCKKDGCTSFPIPNGKYCLSHRIKKKICQYQDCTTGASRSAFCIKHGGGKRCQYQDCINGSISKSVFCKKHGGGKKCQYQGCTTNSRGKDNFCKKHGGGKRCQYHECTTSSQGNSNFCVLHGGGKRCPNCIEWIDSRCGNSKYDDYCATCFKRLFPEDPRSKFIYEHTKEIRVRNEISKTFTGFIHDKCMYIGGCDCPNKRRVDHRKLIDGTILAVETDEFSHRGYDKKDEEIRYDDLYMIHSGKWIYIRFNPDITRTQNVDLEDRIDILLSEIAKQIKRIEMGENKDLVEIIKLFY